MKNNRPTLDEFIDFQLSIYVLKHRLKTNREISEALDKYRSYWFKMGVEYGCEPQYIQVMRRIRFMKITCAMILKHGVAIIEHQKQVFNDKLKIDMIKIRKSKLFKECLKAVKSEVKHKHNNAIKAASEFTSSPKATAHGEYHLSLGNGNRVSFDDESFHDAAAVSLGMFCKNLPSNQYS